MLQTLDSYLRRESIDVARILGAVCFVGAMQSVLGAFASYASSGNFHLNIFSLAGVLLSIAIWQRLEFARKLSLGILYLTLGVFVWMVIQTARGQSPVMETGGVRASQPIPPGRMAVALALTAPFPLFMILLLHTPKVREEFRQKTPA